MSVAVAAPDGGSTDGALTGAATIHEVLQDGSDSTYVTLDENESFTVTLGDTTVPTFPAGGVVTSLSLAIRTTATAIQPTPASIDLADNDPIKGATPAVPFGGPKNWYAVTATYSELNDTIRSGDISDVELRFYNGGSGPLVAFSAYLSITYVAKPTVSVTLPTGTLTEDNTPNVTWTNTLDVAGGGQFAANVRIFPEPGGGWGGFDPEAPSVDAVHSEDFFATRTVSYVTTPLANGDYRAYVKVAQFYNTSDWDYEEFTIDIDEPGVPIFEVSDEGASGRLALQFEDTTGETTTDGYFVERYESGEWVPIRTLSGLDGIVEGTELTVYDYEAPPGVVVPYRVSSYHDYTDSRVFSTTYAYDDSPYEVSSPKWWLKHPTKPGLNVTCDLRAEGFNSLGREARQSVSQPLGRTDAVVVSDERGPETGQVVFAAPDDGTLGLLKRIASTASPLFLAPPGDHHEPGRWVVLGNESVDRIIGQAWSTERNVTYDWTVVSRPDGAIEDYEGLYPSDYLYPSDDLYPR